jgi:molecular chaperone GrpE
MDKKASNKKAEDEKKQVDKTTEANADIEKTPKKKPKKQSESKQAKQIRELKEQLDDMNDKYLRLSAEFDNYRKRTLKEKMDLTKLAGRDIFENMLPVIDDMERAAENMVNSKDLNALKEGLDLILAKFSAFLTSQGVKPIDSKGKEFDTDEHEAVTKIPAPSEDMKGKVVDVITKGYKLNDQILRYSKVVVGE